MVGRSRCFLGFRELDEIDGRLVLQVPPNNKKVKVHTDFDEEKGLQRLKGMFVYLWIFSFICWLFMYLLIFLIYSSVFYLFFTHLFDFICLSVYFINCFIDFTRILPTNGHNHAEKSFTNWDLRLLYRSNCDFTGYLVTLPSKNPSSCCVAFPPTDESRTCEMRQGINVVQM